jgi:excisionase family DNA binding protein
MRFRVVVTRAQVTERFIRAADEEDAAKRIQEELDRPYGFLGSWKTTNTGMEITEVESSLREGAPALKGEGKMLLSVKESAAHLGISYSQLYELIRTGEIQHVAIGRRRYISRDGLKAFIEANSHVGMAYRE